MHKPPPRQAYSASQTSFLSKRQWRMPLQTAVMDARSAVPDPTRVSPLKARSTFAAIILKGGLTKKLRVPRLYGRTNIAPYSLSASPASDRTGASSRNLSWAWERKASSHTFDAVLEKHQRHVILPILSFGIKNRRPARPAPRRCAFSSRFTSVKAYDSRFGQDAFHEALIPSPAASFQAA